jgi:hypothetical protein
MISGTAAELAAVFRDVAELDEDVLFLEFRLRVRFVEVVERGARFVLDRLFSKLLDLF